MQTNRLAHAAAVQPTAVAEDLRMPLPGSPWAAPSALRAMPAVAPDGQLTGAPRGPRVPSPVGPWRVPADADAASTVTHDADVFDAGPVDRDDVGLLEGGRFRAPRSEAGAARVA